MAGGWGGGGGGGGGWGGFLRTFHGHHIKVEIIHHDD